METPENFRSFQCQYFDHTKTVNETVTLLHTGHHRHEILFQKT